ncbi:hypothetical protein CSKR_103290 [Clonorchis sinensis]|uniref:Uncharacterized protein n=1 Tax=Clonorchis sinensis TaxID=79923 RepID=A0A3R7FUL4_CLOSI|nr:hypothetical protein CSKR_103290 [Clonorchis sinensis]
MRCERLCCVLTSQKQLVFSTDWRSRSPLWLEREFTDRKVRGSNPASGFELPLSWLRQLGSIPALELPSGGMAVRHRKDATTERFLLFVCATSIDSQSTPQIIRQFLEAGWPQWLERESADRKVRGSNPTSTSRLPQSSLWQLGSIPAFVLPLGGMAVRHRKDATTERFLLFVCATSIDSQSTPQIIRQFLEAGWPQWLERESADRKVRGSNPRIRPLPLDFPSLVFGNLAVSQPSCFHWVAWQLGTERVLQLNDPSILREYKVSAIIACLPI